MVRHRAVGRLVLEAAVRRHQHTGHHGQGAKGGGHHIAHHIAVIVLARPDIAALRLHHTRHRVIDQCVEICDAGIFELLRILAVKNLLENILEGVVVFFGDGILGGKPQILLCVKCIVKAASRKALDGIAEIVLSLHHARTGKIVDQFSCLGSVLRRVDQFAFARSRNLHLARLIDVAVCMSRDRDRLFPVLHARLDPLDDNRCTEHRSVQHGANRSVRALPHLLEMILRHTGGIRRNRRTFYSNPVLFRCICRIYGNLIVRLVAVFQSEIIILRLKIDKRIQQFVFDHFPENPCHLISVHLYKWRCHFDFFHGCFLSVL